MISLISIGITECHIETLCDIKCAFSDANSIYEEFEHILKEQLCSSSSICLKDIYDFQFEKLIKTIAQTLKEGDILVIYFSGHALNKGDRINLVFSNADNKGEGLISSGRLNECLKNLPIKTLLILDCCYSGAGLRIADNTNIFDKSKISVIASNESYERATFNQSGSDFTNSFKKALKSLYEKNQAISLHNIVMKIRDNDKKCFVNYLEGEPDLILKEKVDYFNEYVDFAKKFLKKINEEDKIIKEMLWYYIMEYPSSVQSRVLKGYRFEPGEASWLVRRAIGSVLSEISDSYEEKKEQIEYLLNADNWMLQCIGLIASRYVNNYDLSKFIKKDILADKTKAMDVVWLANLYLTDKDNITVEESLSSRLGNTSWGIIDIWKRYIKTIPCSELWMIISNKITEEQLLAPLMTDLIILEEQVSSSLPAKLVITTQFKENNKEYMKVAETKLVKYLYKQNKRGRTKTAHEKWLISLLYGSWRDQISLDLNDYFDNTLNSTISYELELAKNLPKVEMRMAIFQIMNNCEEIFKKYYKTLMWGLIDVHPWVRREAINVYGSYFPDYIEYAFNDTIDRNIYPGMFDMVIEAERVGYNTGEYLEKYELTNNENEAIKKYIR